MRIHTLSLADQAASDDNNGGKLRYETPDMQIVGAAVAMMQGRVGMSGQDRNYCYRYTR
jgi:hypothetical protein